MKLLNFTMQYLDKHGRHLKNKGFDQLSDALATAEKETKVAGFNIAGMGQFLSAKRDDTGNLGDWLGCCQDY